MRAHGDRTRWRRLSEGKGLALGSTTLLIGSVAGLVLLYDLDQRPWGLYALLAVGFASLATSSWSWPRHGLTARRLILVAGLLRVLLIPLPPSLSNDVYRYIWDGAVVAAGYNPYLLPPEAPELKALRDDGLWQAMSHRDVETVYPPLALVVFSIAARLPFSLLAYKLLLVAVDLLGCALLVSLAVRRGEHPSRPLWYAWNPLVVLEVAGMGHVDALGVLAVTATVMALTGKGTGSRGAVLRGALAASAAVLAKLIPLVALPLWMRQSGRPLRFSVLVGGILAVTLAPILWSARGVPPGLLRYGISWEFNGPLYEPLWRLLRLGSVDDGVKGALDWLKLLTGKHELWNPIYPFVYPQLLAKVLLGLILLVVIWRSFRQRDPWYGTQLVLGGALLLSATLYPWYLLWVLPWAALRGSKPWLILSCTLPLAYLPQLIGVPLFPWIFLGIWLPFLFAWIHRWSTG